MLVVLVLVTILVVAGLGLRVYWKAKYPCGWSHCCIDQIMFALNRYADEHGGRYPAGEATPEASLSLLCKGGYVEAYTLSGMTVHPEAAEKSMRERGRLGPESCGWHYVEGLSKADDRRLAILWCKEPLGHNGDRTPSGGRQVLRVDWAPEWISGKDWPAFLAEQERLMSERSSRAVTGRPLLTAGILLPDGTITNAYRGSYTLSRESQGSTGASVGSESGSALDPSLLAWHHAEVATGVVTYTLSFSNLVSQPVSVEFQDDMAEPSNIVFRMRAHDTASTSPFSD